MPGYCPVVIMAPGHHSGTAEDDPGDCGRPLSLPPLPTRSNSERRLNQEVEPPSPAAAVDSSSPSSSEASSTQNEAQEEFVPIVRSGSCANIGNRRSMEDAHVLVDDLSKAAEVLESVIGPRAFYGVFDGHGGAAAAQYVQSRLLANVLSDVHFPHCVRSAFRSAYLRTDSELEALWRSRQAAGEAYDSGTTALAVLVLGRTLFVANAGDCRAVLSRRGKAVEISRDHRATTSPEELRRVQAAGGYVADDYLNEKLAVTRALGDWHFDDLKSRLDQGSAATSGPLIAEPEVFESQLSEDDEFLVLACDGLWDAFRSSHEVVEYARKRLCFHNDPVQCSEELVNEALNRDTADNVTVLTICFSANHPPPLSPQRRRWGVHSRSRHGAAAVGVASSAADMRRSFSVESMQLLQKCLDKN